MTASNTQRLSLMSPTASDVFLPADFKRTFDILDERPGILPVPNQSSRPSNYGPNQNGSCVLQTDLGILWYWRQPSSAVAGTWERVMGKGTCGTWVNPTPVSTQSPDPATGAKCVETEIVAIGGGRPLLIDINWDNFGNDYGKCRAILWCNNVQVRSFFWAGYRAPACSGGSISVPHNPAPNYQASLRYHLTIHSVSGSPPNGGGLTVISGSTIIIRES